MGTWNFRVLSIPVPDEDNALWIGEVHYGDDGAITGWSEEVKLGLYTGVDEIRAELDLIREALDKPVVVVSAPDGEGPQKVVSS